MNQNWFRIFLKTLLCGLYLFAFKLSYASGMFFNVAASGLTLNIQSNLPSTYLNVGIKISNTNEYTLSGIGSDCTLSNNGFCTFAMSSNETKGLELNGERGGVVSFMLCLNADAMIACQHYTTTIPELLSFQGVRTDLTETEVLAGGFSVCYNEYYGSVLGATAQTVKTPCTQDILLVACRQTDSNLLTAAAMALNAEVFFDSGSGVSDSHVSNGTQWYYSANLSFGFAGAGDPLTRQACDTNSVNPENRLCWHTSDVGSGGYRCGANTSLNSSSAWQKVVYQRDGSL